MLTSLRTIGLIATMIVFTAPAMSQTVISMPKPPKTTPAATATVEEEATDDQTAAPTAGELDPLGVTALTRYAMARRGSDYTYGMADDSLRGRYVRNYGWPYVYSPAVFYGYGFPDWGWGWGSNWFGGGWGHGGHHGGHGRWWCGPSWTIDITID